MDVTPRQMGATVAHKALERVADGTCTQVWAWMTNKYRRRRIYNNRDLTKKGEIEKQREKEEGTRLQFLGLLKTLAVKYKRTEKKKN